MTPQRPHYRLAWSLPGQARDRSDRVDCTYRTRSLALALRHWRRLIDAGLLVGLTEYPSGRLIIARRQ